MVIFHCYVSSPESILISLDEPDMSSIADVFQHFDEVHIIPPSAPQLDPSSCPTAKNPTEMVIKKKNT